MLIIFFRSMIVFLLLLVVMRLMGKRQIGEMQPFELVITLVISELATIPMADVSIPIMYGVISIFTLLIMHHVVAMLSRKSINLRKIICGRPTIVVTPNGVDFKELKSLSMSVSDLLEAMRGAGYFGFDEIEYGIFETNGKFSVLQSNAGGGSAGASSDSGNSSVGGATSSDDGTAKSKSGGASGQTQQPPQQPSQSQPQPSPQKNQSRVQRERDKQAQQEQQEQQTQPPELPALPLTVIEEGKLVKNTLKITELDEEWILKQLARIHEDQIKNVLVATIDNNGKMYVQQRGKRPVTLNTFFRGGNNW